MVRYWVLLFSSSVLLVSCTPFSSEEREQNSLVRAGDRVYAAGDPVTAINVYKSALEKNPSHKLPIYLKLGEAYMNARQLEEAKKIYEEALPYDENDEIKKQLGKLYLTAGQPDQAISIFEGVLLVHKDDLRAYNGLGVAYDLKGDHKLAQESYGKALQINPENDEVKSNLGLSLAFEGKYSESLKLLQPIGERLDATSQQRHNLALVYALAGDHAKSQELYAKDMDIGEINGNLHLVQMATQSTLTPRKKEKLNIGKEIIE